MNRKIPITIFLADDDPDDRHLFGEALKRANINATLSTFTHCSPLLKHLENGMIFPDLIFLDINMPLLNGKECLRKIREEARFLHIPVIIYSTSATDDDIEDTFRDGANLYVAKPFAFAAQVAMFQKIIELYIAGTLEKRVRSEFVFKHV